MDTVKLCSFSVGSFTEWGQRGRSPLSLSSGAWCNVCVTFCAARFPCGLTVPGAGMPVY